MPEQISKYPEVTLQVLKRAGARCGEGAEQRILTSCPSERFCSLPTGEICVYGIQDIPRMTQITTHELARVVSPPARESAARPALSAVDVGVLGATFAVGLLVGNFWQRSKRRRAREPSS